MSVSPLSAPPPHARSRVVARLRSAGCVFAEDEAELLITAAATPADLDDMVGRRVAGHPLEYILGWVEFHGLRVAVEPGVFVPRRRTEFLVDSALDLARRAPVPTAPGAPGPPGRPPGPPPGRAAVPAVPARRSRAVVVDLCCGSGAVGAALGAVLPGTELYAVDIDPAAVRCARRNLAGIGALVYAGDLYGPLPAGLRGRVDVLVANAPYVPTGAVGLLPPEARVHEPRVALDGGADGLDVLRRVIAGAPPWLAPAGRLLVETSEHQVPGLVEAVTRAGMLAGVARSEDLAATVVTAARGPGSTPCGRG